MRKFQFNSPRELAAVLARRKWWLLVTFVVLASGVIFVAMVLPPIYVSDTLIAVESREVPDEFVPDLISAETDQRLNIIQQTILSRTNLLRIYRDFEDRLVELHRLNDEERYEALRSQVSIEFERFDRRSQISHFRVMYENKDPRLAQAITNRLADRFIEEHNKNLEQQVFGTGDFFRTEVAKVSSELEQVESELRELKEKYRYELPEFMDANQRTLDRLQEQLASNAESMDRAQARKMQLERQLSETPRQIAVEESGQGRSTPRLSEQMREYQEKERAYQELASQYTERHPAVRKAKSELEALRAKIPAEEFLRAQQPAGPEGPRVTRKPNPDYQDIADRLEEVRAEIGVLSRERKDILGRQALYQRRVDNTPKREQELSALQRRYKDLSETHKELNAKLADAELASSLESKQKGERFSIVDPARLPLTPDKPNRPLIVLVGLFASLGIGIAAAVARDFMEQRFYNHIEVEDFFQVPVLVEIPQILSKRDQSKVRILRWAAYSLLAILVAGSVAGLYWVYQSPEIQAWGTRHLQKITQLVSR